MVEVLFVCLGNICRSPMAEAIFRHLVQEAGLQEQIAAASAGTGNWHVGEPAHRGTRFILKQYGIGINTRARQVSGAELRSADYVVAMDSQNLADLQEMDRRGELVGKLFLLTDFLPSGGPRDVPDPYYEGNFETVYRLVRAGCESLLERIKREQGW